MTDEQKSLTVITPAMDIQEFTGDVKSMMGLVKSKMREGQDFGVIPGTGKKSLFDPGAEKLAKFFGLVPQYEELKVIEEFDKGFVYYKYRCTMIHFKSGKFAGSAERSCNNKERKFASRPVYEIANTIAAMAQKRAFVEAVKTATMASEIFVTGEDSEEVPDAPVTKAEDPVRASVMARYFSAGSERGFTTDGLKAGAYKRYGVSSMTELSNKQINELSEELMTTWDVVAKGDKPKKLGVFVQDGEIVNTEPTIVNQLSTPPDSVVNKPDQLVDITTPDVNKNGERLDNLTGNGVKVEGDTVTLEVDESGPTECRCGCKEIVPAGNEPKYFINREHQDRYWGQPKKPTYDPEPWKKWRKGKDA